MNYQELAFASIKSSNNTAIHMTRPALSSKNPNDNRAAKKNTNK